ncbi:hypothetical protein [Novosphingobium sediminicola]|uniref:Uncharacterized protein n=1 Tax=Novosphingobium sediminicola TaxID=563162 RepID=A0A7W6CJ42_9SPHN|nr:hypothetical protein [Novosphingobium sediminicola]MBB3954006.1 hypothetical protein [Novosphingobium sediminicola]
MSRKQPALWLLALLLLIGGGWWWGQHRAGGARNATLIVGDQRGGRAG